MTTAPSSLSRLGMMATLVVAATWCVAVHLLIVDDTMPPLTLLVITAPWLLAGASALLAATRERSLRFAPALVGVGLAAAASAVWRLGVWLGHRVDVPIFAESFVFLVSLSVLFAASLFGEREALVTRLARIARRGDMPPAVVRYTRRVTIGWSLFFALAALLSATLFATQARDVWSGFVNLVLWPLTAIGFAVEYAIRVRVLPDVRHGSPLGGVQAFMQRDDVAAEDRAR